MLRRYWSGERAFALLETIILSMVVVGLLGLAMAMQTAVKTKVTAAAQIGAVFLAQEQMASLKERHQNGELSAGNVEWLGEKSDLSLNGTAYAVETTLAANGTGFRGTVVVSYAAGGTNHEERFERLFP